MNHANIDPSPKLSVNFLKKERLRYKHLPHTDIRKIILGEINSIISLKQSLYFSRYQYIRGWKWGMSQRRK